MRTLWRYSGYQAQSHVLKIVVKTVVLVAQTCILYQTDFFQFEIRDLCIIESHWHWIQLAKKCVLRCSLWVFDPSGVVGKAMASTLCNGLLKNVLYCHALLARGVLADSNRRISARWIMFFSIVSHILVLRHSVCWFLLIREHFWNILGFFTEIYTHFGINQTLPCDFSDVTDFCFNSTKSLLRLLLLLLIIIIIIILLTLLEKPLTNPLHFFRQAIEMQDLPERIRWSCAFLWTLWIHRHDMFPGTHWNAWSIGVHHPPPLKPRNGEVGWFFGLFLRRWPGGWWTHPNVSWTWFIWLISNKHNIKCVKMS